MGWLSWRYAIPIFHIIPYLSHSRSVCLGMPSHSWVRMVNMNLKSLLKSFKINTTSLQPIYFIFFLFHVFKYHIKSWTQEEIFALPIFLTVLVVSHSKIGGEKTNLVITLVLKLWFSNVATRWNHWVPPLRDSDFSGLGYSLGTRFFKSHQIMLMCSKARGSLC